VAFPPGLPDRRGLADQILALLDGPGSGDLSTAEVTAARALLSRFKLLDESGLPDTIVHGDFHPGNWRSGGGPPVILDWADAHIGRPGPLGNSHGAQVRTDHMPPSSPPSCRLCS
jgi:hypothetical protein